MRDFVRELENIPVIDINSTNTEGLDVSKAVKVRKVDRRITYIKGPPKSGSSRSLIATWIKTPGALLVADKVTIEGIKNMMETSGLEAPHNNHFLVLGNYDVNSMAEAISTSETLRKAAFIYVSKPFTMDDFRKVARLTQYVLLPCVQVRA